NRILAVERSGSGCARASYTLETRTCTEHSAQSASLRSGWPFPVTQSEARQSLKLLEARLDVLRRDAGQALDADAFDAERSQNRSVHERLAHARVRQIAA